MRIRVSKPGLTLALGANSGPTGRRITMTKGELTNYRQQLLDLGKRFKGKVSKLEQEASRKAGSEPSGGLSNVPLHMADLASDSFEQDVAISLLETEEQTL